MRIATKKDAKKFIGKEVLYAKKPLSRPIRIEKAFNPSVPVIAASIAPGHHQAHLEDPHE